eukprot:scaffold448908_cov18-Prasinocladus_malaysianus.AAC.1
MPYEKQRHAELRSVCPAAAQHRTVAGLCSCKQTLRRSCLTPQQLFEFSTLRKTLRKTNRTTAKLWQRVAAGRFGQTRQTGLVAATLRLAVGCQAVGRRLTVIFSSAAPGRFQVEPCASIRTRTSVTECAISDAPPLFPAAIARAYCSSMA